MGWSVSLRCKIVRVVSADVEVGVRIRVGVGVSVSVSVRNGVSVSIDVGAGVGVLETYEYGGERWRQIYPPPSFPKAND